MRTVRLLAPLLGLVILAATAAPALAEGDTGAWTDGRGVGARAASTGPAAGGSGGGASPCTYTLIPPGLVGTGVRPVPLNLYVEGHDPSQGRWYARECRTTAGLTLDPVWIPTTAPAVLAREALQYAPIAPPAIGMNPPSGRDQLVNLATWLWVARAGWRPASASASAGEVSATATATPLRVVWEMGDGGRVVCAGPGSRYDPGRPEAAQRPSCAYTYRCSSAGEPGGRFVVTATVEWQVTWTATGVPPGAPAAGDLGVVRRATSVPVRVAEVQALNTAR